MEKMPHADHYTPIEDLAKLKPAGSATPSKSATSPSAVKKTPQKAALSGGAMDLIDGEDEAMEEEDKDEEEAESNEAAEEGLFL